MNIEERRRDRDRKRHIEGQREIQREGDWSKRQKERGKKMDTEGWIEKKRNREKEIERDRQKE